MVDYGYAVGTRTPLSRVDDPAAPTRRASSSAARAADPAIEIVDLRKSFSRTKGYRDIFTFWRREKIAALKGVSLEVSPGKTMGILGPNGAGKTTLLKILAGLVLPDSGIVEVNGRDISDGSGGHSGDLVYVAGEERSLYWRLTGRENLVAYAVLNEVPGPEVNRTVAHALEVVGLTAAANEHVSKYSSGMKQRLCIARGLLASPRVLLLDEPTRSLDVGSAVSLWNFIKNTLVEQMGTTVVIASHNLDEVRFLCHSLTVLHQGVVALSGPLDSISTMLNAETVFSIGLVEPDGHQLSLLQDLPGYRSVENSGTNGQDKFELRVTIEDVDRDVPQVLDRLQSLGIKVREAREIDASLADVIEKVTAN